jgi:branched-chain amino acid transport system substrate-binding protein
VAPGAANNTRQLKAAAEAKPAAVLIIAGVEDAARLTRIVREQLGSAAIFGSHVMGRMGFQELAGPAAEGVRFPLLFVLGAGNTNTARFVARFASERRHPADYAAALTYDATCLLLEAIRRAGPNRARIREALAQLSPWRGLAGPIHFDGTGQNTQTNIFMGTIRDGVVVPLAASGLPTETVRSNPEP